MIRTIINLFRNQKTLASENEDLRKRLEAATSGDWSKVRLIKVKDGSITMGSDIMRAIAEFFTQSLEKEDGTYHNYMEVEFTAPRMGKAVLLCQRVSGKTPNQLVKDAKDDAVEKLMRILYEEEGNVINPGMADRIQRKMKE